METYICFPIKCIFVSQNCTGTGNRTLLYWIGDDEAEHRGVTPATVPGSMV